MNHYRLEKVVDKIARHFGVYRNGLDVTISKDLALELLCQAGVSFSVCPDPKSWTVSMFPRDSTNVYMGLGETFPQAACLALCHFAAQQRIITDSELEAAVLVAPRTERRSGKNRRIIFGGRRCGKNRRSWMRRDRAEAVRDRRVLPPSGRREENTQRRSA